jgi:hypothetical protein
LPKITLNGRAVPHLAYLANCLICSGNTPKYRHSFCHARLSAAQVTGKDEGPIAVAALDVTKLMDSPELVAMAQTLALNLSGYPTTPKQLAGPEENQ